MSHGYVTDFRELVVVYGGSFHYPRSDGMVVFSSWRDVKKIVLRSLGLLVVLVVVAMGLQIIASETGEVVVVTTQDQTGAKSETRLWIVAHEGSRWLRSGGGAASRWYQQLLANPQLELLRGTTRYYHRATPVPDMQATVNDLMSEKYGWADSYVGFLFGREDAIAIRLDDLSVP